MTSDMRLRAGYHYGGIQMNCDLRILFRALRQWPTAVAWAEK